MTKGRKMICSRIETKVRRNRKNRVSSALGRGGPVVIALWALLICAFAFAVYKDFTAVDTHTVHETTVVQEEVTDTNAIESFVTNFAKVYYSWEQSRLQ